MRLAWVPVLLALLPRDSCADDLPNQSLARHHSGFLQNHFCFIVSMVNRALYHFYRKLGIISTVNCVWYISFVVRCIVIFPSFLDSCHNPVPLLSCVFCQCRFTAILVIFYIYGYLG